MTINNITPADTSVINHGQEISFDLNDGGSTPTYFRVTIEGAGTTVAWDLTTGFGSGYAGTSVKVGNVYTVSFSKGAGWDASPFTVSVTRTISAVTSTTEWSYELLGENQFPALMQPRNPLSDNSATLDTIINGDNPDNDVIVPSLDPIVLKTAELNVTPLLVENTNPSYDDADDADSAVLTARRTGSGFTTETQLRGDTLRFARTGSTGSFSIDVKQNTADDTTGLFLYVTAGQAGADVGGGADGGDLFLQGGSPTGSGNKYGDIVLNNAEDVRIVYGLSLYETAAFPGTLSATYGKLWVKDDNPNKLMYTDGDGTDFTLLIGDGTEDQAAILLPERADHVNTPAAGKGEIWVKDQTPARLYFTDDAGTDWDLTSIGSGDVTGAASGTDNAVTRFNGTSGKIIQDSDVLIFDDGELRISSTATDPALVIAERATPPTNTAGYGKFWVQNDVPCTPGYTNDSSEDFSLGSNIQHVAGGLNTNGTVNQWYTWDVNGPFRDATWSHASGGTGSAPTGTGSTWTYPGIYFGTGGRLLSIKTTMYANDAVGVQHDLEFSLAGFVPSLITSTPTLVEYASTTTVVSTFGTPKTVAFAWTTFGAVIPSQTKCYIFVRETGGLASRIDMTNATFDIHFLPSVQV